MKRTNSRTRTRVLRPWLIALLLLFGICIDVSAQEYPEYYRKALNVIKDGHTYRIFTEVDGQRYYVTGDGRLTTNKTDAPAYLFTKTRGEAWEFGFMLQNGNTYFTSPDESITTYDACESLDHLCTTSSSPSSVWDAQVFFLNDAGKYAIRSSNAPYIFGDEGRNALCDWGWTVRTGAKGPEMGYHGVLDYIWQLDEDLSTGIYTEHTSTYYFGTTFPLFQFEVDNAEGLTPIDDDVTVNYTRYALNGNTYWTEHYAFSKLKKHNLGSGTFAYDLPFSFTEEHPELSHDELTLDNLIITANVFINMRNAQGETRRVVATSHLKYKYRDIVIDNIEGEMTYIAGSAPKFVQEIRYARKGSSVVFKIPQQNISSSYIPKSEWQERVEDGEYEHITITYQPHYSNWNDAITEVDFNTYVYYPDQNDTLVSHITLVPVDPYEHMTLYVDGFPENSTTFSEVIDVGQQVESLQNDLKDGGIVSWNVDSYIPIGYFQAFDDLYGGADVTLTCDGEVIQKMTKYNGAFSFRPPTDGHTYNVEVYFPGYEKRYNRTYKTSPLTNIYRLAIFNPSAYGDNWEDKRFRLSFIRDGQEYQKTQFAGDDDWHAFMYAEEPVDFYLCKADGSVFTRLSFPDWFKPLEYNIKPELIELTKFHSLADAKSWSAHDENGYSVILAQLYPDDQWTSRGSRLTINWDEIGGNNSLITVVNSKGEPVTNATLRYACVDKDMTRQGNVGSAPYISSFGGYLIDTDPAQYAELIEVDAPGYQPTLVTMHLWNYDYFSTENRNKTRRYTIVLTETDTQLSTAQLETLQRFGNVKDAQMNAKLATNNLLAMTPDETLDYSQNGDYESVTKTVDDEKFGDEGWTGTKYVRLCGSLPYTDSFDTSQLALECGPQQLAPLCTRLVTTADFPGFTSNHCLFEFDLVDQIEDDATVQPVVKLGTETLAGLPSLHNSTIDLIALSEASNVNIPGNGIDLTKVDDEARSNQIDMKDMNKAFDKFNFSTPPVLPFTVNIEREGDYFLVRGVCEYNLIPGGAITNLVEKLDNLNYFDEQYRACMAAVKAAKPADDNFFEDIPRSPSLFVGIKGFLSGIGHYNPETKKIDINFYDGGLTFEAAAKASANVSFFIGGFGMSVDAKIAATMALVNRAAALGDAGSLPQIDFQFDTQARLKVCAWAYGGIDIWIAKATAGVRGGASFDVHSRVVIPTYNGDNLTSGTSTTVRAAMEAYAEARFLCFTTKKSWTILDAQKTYYSPNDPSNPLHPRYNPGIFSYSSRNVTRDYKKLKRKVIADLGTPIVNNVSGMAQPRYLQGGTSLLFNNLKTAGDYNDDRIQVYSGSKSDLVDTGIDAPMYDFDEARGGGLELVAFEQVKTPIDKAELEAMAENDQIKSVTENTGIWVAMRTDGGPWTTQQIGDPDWENASVAPGASVQQDGKAAVIWQQGVAKYNDEGDRYIDGTLMLSRYDGTTWSDPVELKRIDSHNVPVDYQLTMKNDSVLVMMTLQQNVNSTDKQASVMFLSVAPDNQIRQRSTRTTGSKPQMVHVGGVNLVGFLTQGDEGRDISLSTVDMKGQPTGKLSSALGMERSMVNDFRLIVDDGAENLDDVALLWNQNDQEGVADVQGTTTFTIKNRIYTSKLCSHDKELYFSTPVEVATMPDDVKLVSMDGCWAQGQDEDVKVVYCVANDNEGAAILENGVKFENAIDHSVDYNAFEVSDEKEIPVTVTVTNNGFEPIGSIDVTLGGETTTHTVRLMPRKTTKLMMKYPVTDSFDGTINYDVTANFIAANSNALNSRRLAARRPHRVQQSGMQANVRQVDMALKMLGKQTGEDATTIVAEVNNASLLPLSSQMTCKVGLYASPLSTEPVGQEVTISAADLYDADGKKNKVKIVTLTAEKPDYAQTLFLRTTSVEGNEAVTDVRPSNNVLPVTIAGKYATAEKMTLNEAFTQAPPASSDVCDVKVVRTINAGEWSTICLPFDMTATELKAAFGDDCRLAEFTGYTADKDGSRVTSLRLNFSTATTLTKNVPYLIKTSGNISGFELSAQVAPAGGQPAKSITNGSMTGTYQANTVVPANSLFLSGNKFYYSVGKTKMMGYRAYFTLDDVLAEAGQAASRITISVDDETTGIGASLVNSEEGIVNSEEGIVNSEVYDLHGRRVERTARKGVFIKNGKKELKK